MTSEQRHPSLYSASGRPLSTEPARVELHPGQLRLLEDTTHPLLAVVSGYGYGKTTFGAAWKLSRAIVNTESIGLIVAPDFKLLKQVCFEAYYEVCEATGLKEGRDYSINLADMVITHKWGHKIIGLTGEKPRKIMAYNASDAWVDETARCQEEVHKQLVARIRCPRARLRQRLYTSTPEGTNWFYDLLNPDKLVREGRYSLGELALVLHGSSYDNPFLPPDFIANLREAFGFDTEYFDNYVLGNWVALLKSRFYFAFKPSNETTIDFDPTIKNFVLTWDFNVDKTSWSVIQEQYRDKLVRIVTHANGSNARTVQEACEQFATQFDPKKYRDYLITVLGDATGHSRSPLTHDTAYDIIESRLRPLYPGLRVEAPHANPLVYQRKYVTNRAFGTGELLVNRRCTQVIKSAKIAESDGDRGIKKPKEDSITHAMESVDMAMMVLDPPKIESFNNGGAYY